MHSFKEIIDYYSYLKFDKKPFLQNFDVITFEGNKKVEIPFMPPFRKDFYQFIFKIQPQKSEVTIDTNYLQPKSDCIICHSPNHIYSWRRNDELTGFIIFFKRDFFQSVPNFDLDFPFFQVLENNYMELLDADAQQIFFHVQKITEYIQSGIDYKVEIIHSLMISLLYFCKHLFKNQQFEITNKSRSVTIFGKFQEYVNKLYLEKRTVEEYADLLHLTPKHLNQIIKEATGKTPRQFIVDRVLLECKNLLMHTDEDVASISYALRFDEPTNFGKFFKRYMQMTPLEFRKRKIINLP